MKPILVAAVAVVGLYYAMFPQFYGGVAFLAGNSFAYYVPNGEMWCAMEEDAEARTLPGMIPFSTGRCPRRGGRLP